MPRKGREGRGATENLKNHRLSGCKVPRISDSRDPHDEIHAYAHSTPDIHALWHPLPPGACPSPRSHLPTDEEIIAAMMNGAPTSSQNIHRFHLGTCLRIEKRVADVRGRNHRWPSTSTRVRARMQPRLPSMEDMRLREHAYDFGGRQDLLKLGS